MKILPEKHRPPVLEPAGARLHVRSERLHLQVDQQRETHEEEDEADHRLELLADVLAEEPALVDLEGQELVQDVLRRLDRDALGEEKRAENEAAERYDADRIGFHGAGVRTIVRGLHQVNVAVRIRSA
jgi:hypothetical protein